MLLASQTVLTCIVHSQDKSLWLDASIRWQYFLNDYAVSTFLIFHLCLSEYVDDYDLRLQISNGLIYFVMGLVVVNMLFAVI